MDDPAASTVLTEREKLMLAFADRFVHDHESIDDELVESLRAHLDDGEVLELCACVARHLGFGRITRVLRLDHTCAIPEPADRPAGPAPGPAPSPTDRPAPPT